MLLNLQTAESPCSEITTSVCIVGAGTAGIFLANNLRKQGISVVLLESGDTGPRRPHQIDQVCEQRGINYKGAELGRNFGVGGTSVLWGGQMIPLSRGDLSARPNIGIDAWPIDYDEISAYFSLVRKHLMLTDSLFEDENADENILNSKFPLLKKFGKAFDLRLSKWLPFNKRNFAKVFESAIGTDSNLHVWINSTVISIQSSSVGKYNRINTLTAKSPNGKKLHVTAEIFVICAGALETTRLLLEHDQLTGGSITSAGAPLGEYFSDHLSVTCGRFRIMDWSCFNKSIGPIFDRGLMRTPRLELTAPVQDSRALASAFAHFTFVTAGDTGFDVVREFLRRRQGELRSYNLTPILLLRVVVDVLSMFFWKIAYKRLWIPRRAKVLLQVDIEQTPTSSSRLLLSNELDLMGRRRLIVDWKVTQKDLQLVREVATMADYAWRHSALSKLADLELTLPDQFDDLEALYDVYHPTGSVRMGNSPASSVVNSDLRIWSVQNCYVSTTAVFPSAGSANPGLMHLALTARLADHIAQQLERKAS